MLTFIENNFIFSLYFFGTKEQSWREEELRHFSYVFSRLRVDFEIHFLSLLHLSLTVNSQQTTKHDNDNKRMNHIPNDQNASIIYKDGIASSVLAAERTWLAWIRTIGKCLFVCCFRRRCFFSLFFFLSLSLSFSLSLFLSFVDNTIVSIVGFGLVLANYFPPAQAIGSFVSGFTVITSACLLVMCTQRYFHTLWMLENKKFTVDRVTPILVSILMGSLLLILIVGGLSNLFRPKGERRVAEVEDKNKEEEEEEEVGGGGDGGEDYMSVQSSSRRVQSGVVARRSREGSLLTSFLSADAIS